MANLLTSYMNNTIILNEERGMEMKIIQKVMLTGLCIATVTPVSAIVAQASSIETLGESSEIVYAGQGLIGSEVDGLIDTKGITSGMVDEGKSYEGYWIRGDKKINDEKHVYSSYKNYKYMGAASVTNGEGLYKDGGYKSPDVMSTANVKWTSAGRNHANYRFK